jgi:hypothetical protein
MPVSMLLRAAAVALVALALPGSALAGLKDRPVLSLAETATPFSILRGTNFRPHQRVVVLVTGVKVGRRVVTTDASGTFRMKVLAAFTPCRGLVIQAIAADGRRAMTGVLSTNCDRGGDIPSTHIAP